MSTVRKEIVSGRGFYYMPSAFLTLKITVEGVYDHARMENAVLALEEAHPIINNVAVKEGDRMWFENVGKHVPIVVYAQDAGVKWEEAVLELTTPPVNLLETPGVMVGVVPQSDCFYLLMVCHHMYGDGISVKILADDLLYLYSTGDKVEVKEAYTELSETDLPEDCKAPEELRDRYVSFNNTCWDRKIEFTWEMYKQMIDTHNQAVVSRISCKNLKGEEYHNFRNKCKELGVTVNSALTTAIAAAMQKGESIDAIVSVDTRPLFGYQKEDGLANFASCVQPTLQYDSAIGFWENVVIVDKKVKQERLNKQKMLNTLYTFMLWGADAFGVGYYARYGMFRDMEVLMELRKTLGLNSEAETFEVSNIGNIEMAANATGMVVRDCYFAPNLMPACACTFGVVSLGETLTISLGYKKKFVSDETAQKIMDDVIAYLKA